MIKPIQNINEYNRNAVIAQHRAFKKDTVSFKGNMLNLITTQNETYLKTLMYMSLNNYQKKTHNLFSKMMFGFFKGLTMISKPVASLMESGSQIYLMTKDNLIKGGLLIQKKGAPWKAKFVMLVQDETKLSKKEKLVNLYEFGKSVCEQLKKDKITDIEWVNGAKNKSAHNLYKKFVQMQKGYEYSTSVESLEKYLTKIKSKYKRLFKNRVDL